RCYYHPEEPAVARCARCGRNLCQDCYDMYGVEAGEYANQALCYDCISFSFMILQNLRFGK
ncbi:MAG: B-box zinc finger protein, partial [Enterococcus casseliflavus]